MTGEGRHQPSYEDGYLQALADLRTYHQQVIDDGAGFDEATGHREAIRFLDRLIAAKEKRRAQQ